METTHQPHLKWLISHQRDKHVLTATHTQAQVISKTTVTSWPLAFRPKPIKNNSISDKTKESLEIYQALKARCTLATEDKELLQETGIKQSQLCFSVSRFRKQLNKNIFEERSNTKAATNTHKVELCNGKQHVAIENLQELAAQGID